LRGWVGGRLSLVYLERMLPLFAAVFLMRFAFSFTVVSLQFIVSRPEYLGVVSSAYPIMEMISGFFVGILADRFGKKWIVAGGLIVSSLVSLAFTFSSNPLYLTFIHGIQGVCAAAIVVSTLAMLTDLARNISRGRDMGAYDFSTIAGYALGFFLAVVIINNNAANAHIPFYYGAVAALIGGVFSVFALKESNVPIKLASIKQNIKLISENRSTQTLLPAWFVLMVLVGVFLTFTRRIFDAVLPLRTGPVLGRSIANIKLDAVVAVLLVIGIILLGFSQTSLGSLSDRFGRSRIALIGQISLMGLLAVLIAILAFHVGILYLTPLLAIFGAGLLAFTPSALAELADVSPETGRGSTMGLYSVSVGAGTVFGPLVGGLLISQYGTAEGLSILFAIGLLILVVFMIPRLLQFSGNSGKYVTQK
jgi:MFS family permease